MTDDFNPDRYHDDYQEQLHELIQAKLEGGEAFTTEEEPKELDETEDVSDLLAKLEASVKARKAARVRRGRTAGDEPAKKAPAKKARGQESTREEGAREESRKEGRRARRAEPASSRVCDEGGSSRRIPPCTHSRSKIEQVLESTPRVGARLLR